MNGKKIDPDLEIAKSILAKKNKAQLPTPASNYADAFKRTYVDSAGIPADSVTLGLKAKAITPSLQERILMKQPEGKRQAGEEYIIGLRGRPSTGSKNDTEFLEVLKRLTPEEQVKAIRIKARVEAAATNPKTELAKWITIMQKQGDKLGSFSSAADSALYDMSKEYVDELSKQIKGKQKKPQQWVK